MISLIDAVFYFSFLTKMTSLLAHFSRVKKDVFLVELKSIRHCRKIQIRSIICTLGLGNFLTLSKYN